MDFLIRHLYSFKTATDFSVAVAYISYITVINNQLYMVLCVILNAYPFCISAFESVGEDVDFSDFILNASSTEL